MQELTNRKEREPQGSHFGNRNQYKIALNFEGAPGIDFRSPRAPSEVKKLYFHWRVVQNRRSTFLPQSAPKVDFGSHFGTQKGSKIIKKRGVIFIEKWKRKK